MFCFVLFLISSLRSRPAPDRDPNPTLVPLRAACNLKNGWPTQGPLGNTVSLPAELRLRSSKPKASIYRQMGTALPSLLSPTCGVFRMHDGAVYMHSWLLEFHPHVAQHLVRYLTNACSDQRRHERRDTIKTESTSPTQSRMIRKHLSKVPTWLLWFATRHSRPP